MKKAAVYKSTGSWYALRDAAGGEWQGRIKGKMRIDEEISSTNPIAVGDEVIFEPEDEDTRTATIQSVSPRNNYMVRLSPHNKNQKHIVASNLDATVVIATIAHPRTSQGFIDRFLVTAEVYHIPAIIVFNKTDLLDEESEAQLDEWEEMYGAAGYRVLRVSGLAPETLEPLKAMLAGRRTLFSGHSGVGKSTLINALIPGMDLRTGEISDWTGKGMHTTTFAEMHDLPGGGQLIDTPGVKEFGLIDIEKDELPEYFPELRALLPQCRFANCKHLEEPGCAVKAALETGELNVDRYVSYATMRETIEEKRW